jgi:glutathione synthase
MALKLLFVADPVDTFNPLRDTTFAIMLEAQRRGHACFEAHLDGLSALHGVPRARCAQVTVQRAERPHHFLRQPWNVATLASFDAIFMRKDPPVDDAYTTALWLLDLTARERTVVINEPRGILAANEKAYALRFPDFIPESLVTRSAADVLAFFEEMNGDIILKPLDGHGGAGVLRATRGDRNLASMIDLLTADGRRSIMVQRYIPAARQGDKRIMLVDGRPVGAILRVPPEHDNRGNIHVGATVEKTTLTPREHEMCEALAPQLHRDGLVLVGIDVIGDLLTEVNVTSPTGVQEIGRLDGTCPEAALLDVVEARAAG